MELSAKAQKIYAEISSENTKLGDLRKVAKEIKKDQNLGKELWSTGKFLPRLLAILIFDPKMFNDHVIEGILDDIDKHGADERLQLADWLMANQLMKDRKLTALILSWQQDPSPLKRRIFWYYQGRLRWTGQTPPDNTKELLDAIEKEMPGEEPEVQWAMNFTAGWIGIFDKSYRSRCIDMGERIGLYKDKMVARNCTPDYLPMFIDIEVRKRKL